MENVEGLKPEEVGRRIREARVKAGLSQPELAASLGVSQSLLSRWERGAKQQSVATLSRIADALNRSVHDLLGLASNDSWAVEDERTEIDRVRRMTITLTMAWRDGQFSSLSQLASTARDLARIYSPVGRGYMEGWLGLFEQTIQDETEQDRLSDDPAGSTPDSTRQG